MKKFLTKKEVTAQFKDYILPSLNISDKPLISYEWGVYTDTLCKNGEISMNQYETWIMPSFKGCKK